MRWKEIREDTAAIRQKTLQGVPAAVAEDFFRGLDDVRHGRTVSVASALTEGRRRIAEYRAKNNKKNVDDPASHQRK